MIRKLLLALFLLIFSSTPALAYFNPTAVPNNRFGIHILFPDELEQAAKLVNSNGGEWGYVTIPIRTDDKNLEKWQAFMDKAAKLKLIPILRLATFPAGSVWTKPEIYDPLDWANFLTSLSWPVENRYIIIYNEPNHAPEWGGVVNAADYAQQLSWTYDQLKNRSKDFFVLPAGLDASVPNSSTSEDEYSFLTSMYAFDPKIFAKIDGWNSHSYPNPGFSGSPDSKAKNGITGFAWETEYIKNNFGQDLNSVFITETGWNGDILSKEQIAQNFEKAFSEVWNIKKIVAVTPFLLSAQAGDFKKFSWVNSDNSSGAAYQKITSIAKTKGQPAVSTQLATVAGISIEQNSNWSADKTGYWHQTTKNIFNNLLNFIVHE